MPLTQGDQAATSGMTAVVFAEIDGVLRPPLEDIGAEPSDIATAQDAWKKLSYGIAGGVIKYLERQPPTKPEYAEAFSSSAEDAAFWAWLAGFVQVFQTWVPVPNDGGLALKTALTAYLGTHPTPSHLSGVLR